MKIAVSGPTGLVGSRIIELLSEDFELIPLKHEQGFDIANKDAVWTALKDLDFDLFLHFAAYTNVDGAETEKELCHKINVEGTKNVFDAVLKKDGKFVQISTDFVFAGKKDAVYFEDSTPDVSTGYYAITKKQAEQAVVNRAMIVRISYPYRASYDKRPDFFRTLKRLLTEGKTLTMVNDMLITPTFIDDVAYGLRYLMNNYTSEIFHLVGAQSLSPLDAGRLIVKTFGLNEKLIAPISFEEFHKGKAPRPQYSVIKSKKNNFHKMRSFEEGLQEIKKQL